MENTWISVKDRLPEVDNSKHEFGERIECLVFYDGRVLIGSFVNFYEPFWSVSWIHSRESLKIDYWQPLPPPPNTENETGLFNRF